MRFKQAAIRIVISGFALCAVSAAGAAQTQQQYPSKPVRIVAPFPAAGTSDFLARTLGQKLTDAWGQQVVVDNRSGAGGVLGTEIVSQAAPDGYTLLMNAIGHAANPSLYKKLPYDTLRDFALVTLIADVPIILAVRSQLSVNSVKELIALARAKPGQLNFAAGGVGASSHWAGELFRSAARIEWQTVQYKGGGPALLAVLTGEVDLMFTPIPSSINHVKAGRVKALAVTSPKRVSLVSNLPTIAEAGLPNYEFQAWYGIVTPAGVARPIIVKLNRDINDALTSPAVRDVMKARAPNQWEAASSSSRSSCNRN